MTASTVPASLPIVSHNSAFASRSALRETFIKGLRDLSNGSKALREVVPSCIQRGVRRKELVLWGVEAGYSAAHVRSLISKILCQSGVRERKSGGGRRRSREALRILEFALDQFGEKGLNYCLAAYRAGKSQIALRSERAQISSDAGISTPIRLFPSPNEVRSQKPLILSPD